MLFTVRTGHRCTKGGANFPNRTALKRPYVLFARAFTFVAQNIADGASCSPRPLHKGLSQDFHQISSSLRLAADQTRSEAISRLPVNQFGCVAPQNDFATSGFGLQGAQHIET